MIDRKPIQPIFLSEPQDFTGNWCDKTAFFKKFLKKG